MLSAESLKQIDIELAKYPADQRRSAIMGALRIAQTEKGWLAPETIAFVADYIGISPAQAYEVATFYNMYDLEPVGKYKLTVCTNLPCALRGGKFTLVEGECMGACGDAPVMLVNNHSMCSFMTEEAIEKKLAELK